MKTHSLPSLDAVIADLWDVSTDDLIQIVGKVNKLAKTRNAGDWFMRLNYLCKDAAISILLTERRECFRAFGKVRFDGAVAMTLSMRSRRVDVHCYPWHLSAEAEALVRQRSASLRVASSALADKLTAAFAA
jgi:hypothetical protein